VNSYTPRFWNEKGFELLSQKGSAVGILKKVFPTPQALPCGVFRNILELTGQIVRSQKERKETCALERKIDNIYVESVNSKRVKEKLFRRLNHLCWGSSKAMRLFSQWFYSKFTKRLEEEGKNKWAKKVLKVNPAKASRICAKCGKEGRPEGLSFKCSCGTYVIGIIMRV